MANPTAAAIPIAVPAHMGDVYDGAAGSWRPLSPGVRRSTLSPGLRSAGVPSSPLRLSSSPRLSPGVGRRLSHWTESQSPIHTLGGAGRPISQRWRDWQQDSNPTRQGWDAPLSRERHGDAYRWGLRANNRVYRHNGPSSMHIDNAIRAAFARFDANNSGRLDYRELRNALQDMHKERGGSETSAISPRATART